MGKYGAPPDEKVILIVDGCCGLCDRITRFVVKRDRSCRFRFVTCQSDEGKSLLKRGKLGSEAMSTFVMVKYGRYYTKSDAALRVFREMGGFWPLLAGFEVIPAVIRDRLYDTIATNRYRWFGRQEACLLSITDLHHQTNKEAKSDGRQTDLRGNRH